MKNFKYSIAFLAVFALLFTSCSKDEASDVSGPDVQDTFQLQFGALLNDFEKQQTKDHNTAPVVCRDAVPTFAKIGLIDNSTGFFVGGLGNDTPFLINVNIQDNNGSWETSYSEVLGLPAGSYSLEYFIVYSGVGDDAEVLWVAPRLGSAFGGDVGAPLPQPITLVAGTKPYINVDVLCYESRVEDAFGYLFFDIELTTVENSYCIFVNYCNTSGEDVDGREYPAKFMVEVWGDAYDGSEVIIAGEMNTINAGPAATVLCLALPKLLPNDTFFVRVTVMDDALLPYDVDENSPPFREFEISQANIDAQLGLTPKYEHVRINCGDDDGGNGCDPDDDLADCDGDDVPNGEDKCPGFDDRNDFDKDGTPDGCDLDDDNDEIPDVDEKNGCQFNSNPDCGGDPDPCASLPAVCHIPQTDDDLEPNCVFAYFDPSNKDLFIKIENVTQNLNLEEEFENSIFGKVSTSIDEFVFVSITGAEPGDRIIAYEIEVRPSNPDGSMSTTCWESQCDEANEGTINPSFNDFSYSYPYYLRVKVISCAEEAGGGPN